MKIFISGDGESGTYLAKLLSSENQDIILMGNNDEHLNNLDARYNILTTSGNPLSVKDLKKAGVADSDLFIAVNKRTPLNITACQLAKLCGARSTVARIDEEELMRSPSREFLETSGIGTMVFPELLAAHEVLVSLRNNWTKNRFELHGGLLTVVAVRLKGNSPLVGLTLRDLANTERTFHVAAIKRGWDLIIPRGSDTLLEGDTIYLVATPENLNTLPALCGTVQKRIRRVMIAGGDKFTRIVAARLMKDYDVVIIEPDRELCRKITEILPDVTVVNASFRNLDVLREEDLPSMDAFLAFSGSDETNIVSCMIAREFGVGTVIAEIEDTQYIAEGESLNIDKVINKKLVTSSHIMRLILNNDVEAPRLMSLESAGVMEIVVREGVKVAGERVRDVHISRHLTIAGVIRGSKGYLVDGDTILMPGDHVVAVCRNGHFKEVDRLFGKSPFQKK